MSERLITFGEGTVSIEDVVDLASQRAAMQLSNSSEFQEKISRGAALLDRILEEDGVVYGVTTGYGDSCTVEVPPNLVAELPVHLTRFHGCGTGRYLSVEAGRAVMIARLVSLARGYSGVSMQLLELLATFIDKNIVPLIPEEGSVGASGDLTPLSYLAGALMGERQVYVDGVARDSADVLKEFGLTPHTLRPKEGLALMNGTAVMTALACIAFSRAEYLTKLASRITSLATLALKGNVFHFSKELFDLKPHPGQMQVAYWIRSDLEHEEMPRNPLRLQDRYSIRCAPHVIGVLADALPYFRSQIETELNSTNDNPIIDPDHELVLHGGHFYGGHIAFVMDSMKNAVANIADLLDRQMALLVDTKYNNGLASNLSGASKDRAMINHGFKAVQIGVSACTAEALKLTMPASVFSRSTECHNQDKVSMGTISARDCVRVLELTEQVAAAVLLASVQALELRLRAGELDDNHLLPTLLEMKDSVFSDFEFLTEDRPLDGELRRFTSMIQNRAWNLYDEV
jgi:histidine ammonia-lyase